MEVIVSVFECLMKGLIDYAGLFPPAGLDMRGAVEAYDRHCCGAHSGMVGRFIVPVGRLGELREVVEELPSGKDIKHWDISVIGGLEFEGDLLVISDFEKAGHGKFSVGAIELKARDSSFIDHVIDFIPEGMTAYFEIPLGMDYRGLLTAISGSGHGANIRTGGLTADLFPTVEEVGEFIWTCRQAGVPFKATAGLHHPVRAFQESVDCVMHGFLNVFCAAGVCYSYDVDRGDIEKIIAIEDADEFQFSGGGLRVFDWDLNEERIVRARREFAHSYGSCSIDEPIEDSQELGLL